MGWKTTQLFLGMILNQERRIPEPSTTRIQWKVRRLFFFRGSDEMYARWWFQIFLIFTPKWEDSQFD